MTRSAAEAEADARARPRRPNGLSWSGACIEHTRVTGGLKPAGDAAPAMRRSRIVSLDPRIAPEGACDWFISDDLSDSLGGHIGRRLASGRSLMTAAFDQWPGFSTVGTSTVDEWLSTRYARVSGFRYAGWSLDFAGQPLVITNPTRPAGSGSTPFDNTTPKEDDPMTKPYLLHGIAGNNSFLVLPDACKIINLAQNADLRVKAIQELGAVPFTGQSEPEFQLRLQLAGFPEVAYNLDLINSLGFLQFYQQSPKVSFEGSVPTGLSDADLEKIAALDDAEFKAVLAKPGTTPAEFVAALKNAL